MRLQIKKKLKKQVRRVKRVLSSLLLLTLFVAYQAGITMFTHVHYVNGVMVAHSHPYKGAHSHSKSSILVIAHISHFHSPEVETPYEVIPERHVIYTVEVCHDVPVVMSNHLQALSLRAPPVMG